MTISHASADNCKILGAALITGSAAHVLLCLAAIPSLISTPNPGFIGVGMKAAAVAWTLFGAIAAVYVGVQALAIIHRRDLTKARVAAIGMLVLPSLGLSGGVSAFMLIPLGAAAVWLLWQPAWYGQFAEFSPASWTGGPDSEGAELNS